MCMVRLSFRLKHLSQNSHLCARNGFEMTACIAAIKSPFSKGGYSLICFRGENNCRGLLGIAVFSREASWFLDIECEHRGQLPPWLCEGVGGHSALSFAFLLRLLRAQVLGFGLLAL